MPGPIVTGALAQIGTSLGLQLLEGSFSRKPGIQLHQQQHRPTQGPFAPVQSAEGPIPLVWGQHDRYAPKLVYAQRTRYDVMVRGQNDPPGTKTQPAQGNRLHLVYGISWGTCQAVDGVWVNGAFRDISSSQTPGDDGEGPRFDLTADKGRGRIYLQADGMQGGAIRRNTLPLANSLDPHTGQLVDLNWKDTDTMMGWSYIYLQFDADPQDVTLEPTTLLESWPSIELSVRGRKVLVPSSADASGWSLGYSDSAAAIAYDLLRLAGHGDVVNARDAWDSHRVCSIQVEVQLPTTASNTTPFWRTAAAKPPKPTAFDATLQNWTTTRPAAPAPEGMTHWWSRRTGTTTDFDFTDVLPWRIQVNDPDEVIGTEGFSSVTSAYGVDVNIEDPDIDLDTDDELKKIVIPPGSPTLPTGGVTPDYMGRYAPQQTGILYPANVLIGSNEFTEQGLSTALRKLEFVMQGRIVRDAGQIRILAGYMRDPIGTVEDGVNCEVSNFVASDSADRQWNVITMGLPNAGPQGVETEIVEVEDEALVARTGRRVLRMGQQEYVADVSHARRLAVTSLVRRRSQRQGYLTLPPDSPLKEQARSGARIRIKSRSLELESYRLNANRQVVSSETTTFVMLGAATNPDGSVGGPIEEDPDENWRIYTALPNLDPDVSEPGVVVPDVANLSLSDNLYQADNQAWQADLIATWDPERAPGTNVRYRITVAAGDSFVEMVDGLNTTRTGPYTGPWEIISVGAGTNSAIIPDVRLGLTYEVQAQHVGVSGRAGDWSTSVTRQIVEPAGLPFGVPPPASLDVHAWLDRVNDVTRLAVKYPAVEGAAKYRLSIREVYDDQVIENPVQDLTYAPGPIFVRILTAAANPDRFEARVHSIDFDGKVSGPSELAVANIQQNAPDTPTLDAPAEPRLAVSGAFVKVGLADVPYADGYAVQRRAQGQTQWEQQQSRTTRFFADPDLPGALVIIDPRPEGTWEYRYSYYIRDVQSEFSDEALVTVGEVTGPSVQRVDTGQEQTDGTGGNELVATITGPALSSSGDEIQLEAVVEPSTGSPAYEWFDQASGGTALSETSSTLTVSPTQDTDYRVEVTVGSVTSTAVHVVQVGDEPDDLPATATATGVVVGENVNWQIALDYDPEDVDYWQIEVAIGSGAFADPYTFRNLRNDRRLGGETLSAVAAAQSVDFTGVTLTVAADGAGRQIRGNATTGGQITNSAGLEFPDSLKPSGVTAARFLRLFRLRSTSGVGTDQIAIDDIDTGAGTGNGDELATAWENSETAITISREGHSVVLPGPNAPSGSGMDATEFYRYEMSATAKAALNTFLQNFELGTRNVWALRFTKPEIIQDVRVRVTPFNAFGPGAAQTYTISPAEQTAAPDDDLQITSQETEIRLFPDRFEDVNGDPFDGFNCLAEVGFTGGSGATHYVIEFQDITGRWTNDYPALTGGVNTRFTGASTVQSLYAFGFAFYGGVGAPPSQFPVANQHRDRSHWRGTIRLRLRAWNAFGEVRSEPVVATTTFIGDDWTGTAG